jgi:MGT family glycosyltransferase
MAKQHIAVFTPFIGGHVYPALGVCSELASRGHRVTYPIDSGFAARVRAAGATPIEFNAPEFRFAQTTAQDVASDDSEDWSSFIAVAPWLLETAAALVNELGTLYARDPPDLILYDWFAFAGRILARRLGCPASQLHFHFAHHHDSLMRIDGVCTNPRALLSFAESVDTFLSTYGFQERGHLWRFEKLNIFCVPREIQYDVDSFDDAFRFVGATHNRQPRAGSWSRAETGKRLLLISEPTSSTGSEFLELCIETFAGANYEVVFSKAPNTPEISGVRLPHNFSINRNVFNCEILPSANLMLCLAGMGTTLEALYHGVPVVAVPSNPFNAEVAYRLAELGLGLQLRQREMTPHTLRAAVDAAFADETLLRRVKRMQPHLANSPGAQAAATAIEAYLQ